MLAGSHGQRNRGWGHEAGIPERREGDKADPIVHQLFPPDNRWVLKLQGQEVLTEVIEQGMKTGDYKAVCKAVDILNKMQGSYVNKLEIGGPDGGPLEFSWAGGDGG